MSTTVSPPTTLAADASFRIGQHPRAWTFTRRQPGRTTPGSLALIAVIPGKPWRPDPGFDQLPQLKPDQRIVVPGWGGFVIERRGHGFRLRPCGMPTDDQAETLDRLKDRHSLVTVDHGPFPADDEGHRPLIVQCVDPPARLVLLTDGRTLARRVDTDPYYEAWRR